MLHDHTVMPLVTLLMNRVCMAGCVYVCETNEIGTFLPHSHSCAPPSPPPPPPPAHCCHPTPCFLPVLILEFIGCFFSLHPATKTGLCHILTTHSSLARKGHDQIFSQHRKYTGFKNSWHKSAFSFFFFFLVIHKYSMSGWNFLVLSSFYS